MRNLREHFALARNAVGHNDVEGGNAVAGDQQKAIAEVKDFTDFSRAHFFDARQLELQNWFVHTDEILKFFGRINRIFRANIAGLHWPKSLRWHRPARYFRL